jgi:transcriptional regulator with XRE-family HTH domain
MTTAELLLSLPEEHTLAEFLLQYRKRHGLSARAAGSRVGASHWAWNKWEQGVVPSPHYLQRLAALVALPIERARELAGPDRVRRPGALGDVGATGLAAARTARGLTASDLARRLHVSPSCLSRWEAGERLPGSRARGSIARVLEMDVTAVDALFGGSAAPSEVVPAAGLRMARGRAGLSQEAVARELGVDASSVRRWERDGRLPAARVRALLVLLQCTDLDERPAPARRLPSPRSSLRRIREQRGIPAVVLASRLGVTPATIWAWERGTRRPDWRMARRLADSLSVPTEHVFSVLGLDLPEHLHKASHDRPDMCSPGFLREVRRWNGMTQQELAQRLGVGRATVADWERARHRPGPRAQLALDALLQHGTSRRRGMTRQ